MTDFNYEENIAHFLYRFQIVRSEMDAVEQSFSYDLLTIDGDSPRQLERTLNLGAIRDPQLIKDILEKNPKVELAQKPPHMRVKHPFYNSEDEVEEEVKERA